MSRQQHNIIAQIETITADLLAVKKKIVVLGDMEMLTPPQKASIGSLRRGLDGVRGFELGEARQSLGLDEDLNQRRKGLTR